MGKRRNKLLESGRAIRLLQANQLLLGCRGIHCAHATVHCAVAITHTRIIKHRRTPEIR